MAEVTIMIPDEELQQVLDDFAEQYGRPELIPDPSDPTGLLMIQNPETKRQHFKRQILTFIRQTSHARRRARQLETLPPVSTPNVT